jgi:hypothetical protein
MSRRQQTLNTPTPISTVTGSGASGSNSTEDDDMTGLTDLVNAVNTGTGLDRPSGSKFETVAIQLKEIVCNLLPIEMVTKKGNVLQFLNQNLPGSTSMIAVLRIGLNDPRRNPAYVMCNLGVIRQHAVGLYKCTSD